MGASAPGASLARPARPGPGVEQRRRAHTWPSRALLADLHLIDLLCGGYMTAVAMLIILYHRRVDGWPLLVAGHLAMIAMAVALPRLAARGSCRRPLELLRVYYPTLVFAWAYLEMDLIQPVLFPDWNASAWLVQADHALFGIHPTVAAARLYGSPLDEVFAFVYLAYYLVPVVVTASLLRRDRLDDLLAAGSAVALTYFTNFILFLLIPAVGPRSVPGLAELHHGTYDGPLFARLCLALEGEAGPIAGAVFPSSHVSATIAWGLAMLHCERRLAWLALGVGLGLVPATVYLGYHHAVDGLTGALLPLATVPAAYALMRRRGERGPAVRLPGPASARLL